MLGDSPQGEQMWRFLQERMNFDSIVTGDVNSVAAVKGTLKSVLESEAKSLGKRNPGTLFIFIYYAGYWQKPNGSIVFT